MKNTQSRKKLTLEQRVARMYNRLPKYLKSQLTKEERKQAIVSLSHQWRLGYFNKIDPKTGKRPKIKNILRSSIEKRQPKRMETKRYLFRLFRTEDPSTFAKYNSYMFRHGYKSTEYFMQNAVVSYVGSNKYRNNISEARLELPEDLEGLARIRRQKVKYTTLVLTLDSGSEFFAELS